MAERCITPEAQRRYSDECNRMPVSISTPCRNARLRVCPPPDVAPVIEQGSDGINLLGVYQICDPKPTELAPYPPSRPRPAEVNAQAQLERMRTQAARDSQALLKLRFRAVRARKIDVSLGFWLGLGLVSVGGVALYLRR